MNRPKQLSRLGFVSLEAGIMLVFLIPLIAAGVLTASYVIFLQDLDSSVSAVLNTTDIRLHGTYTGDQGFVTSNLAIDSLGSDGGTGHYVRPPEDDDKLSEASKEVRDSFEKMGQKLFQAFKSKIDPWCSNLNCPPDSYEVTIRIASCGIEEKNGDYRTENFGPQEFALSAHRYYGTLEHPHSASEIDPLFKEIFDVLNTADSAALTIFSPLMGSTSTQFFGNYRSYSFMSPASINVGEANNENRRYFRSLSILGGRAFIDITKTRIGDFLNLLPPLCTSLGGHYDSINRKCTRILVGTSKVTASRLQL